MKTSYTSMTLEEIPIDIEFYFHAFADEPVELISVIIHKTEHELLSILSNKAIRKIEGYIILNAKSIKRDDYL